MKKKIALFTNINKNYFFKAVRCFEIFEEQNPGVFDFFIVTSDTEAKSLPNVNVIILNPNDFSSILSIFILIPFLLNMVPLYHILYRIGDYF